MMNFQVSFQFSILYLILTRVTVFNTQRHICRGIFRTQSNIYHGALLRKYFTAFSRELSSQKNSINNVRLDSKYASAQVTVAHDQNTFELSKLLVWPKSVTLHWGRNRTNILRIILYFGVTLRVSPTKELTEL